MLQHNSDLSNRLKTVAVMGAFGFVGRAVTAGLAESGLAVNPIGRRDLDLLAEDAAPRLAQRLDGADCLVFVSAVAPTRDNAELIDNLRMAKAVIEALSGSQVAHAVYVSSDAVYADSDQPITEQWVRQPETLHGIMHAAREMMLGQQLQQPLCILRPSLLYGPQDPHNGYGPNRFRGYLARGEPITLYGGGEERRDHVFVEDVGKVVAQVVRHASTGVCNIATGRSLAFRDVAQMSIDRHPKTVPVSATERRPGVQVTHRHFDISALSAAFPSLALTSLEEGIASAIAAEAD